MLLYSATKELRGGGGLVRRLGGVGHIVSERCPSTFHRALIILSTAAKRGTLTRTGRFGRMASVAKVILAGVSKATGKKVTMTVRSRLNVPMGCVNMKRAVSSLRGFSSRRFMGTLFCERRREP